MVRLLVEFLFVATGIVGLVLHILLQRRSQRADLHLGGRVESATASRVNTHENEARQEGDDADHDEDLDQRKAVLPRALAPRSRPPTTHHPQTIATQHACFSKYL